MFFDRYAELCKKQGKTPTGVALELNVARSTVSYWRTGAAPKQDILLKIGDYFGVSVDYLLGGEKESNESETIKFALWGGDAEIVDDEMLEDVKDFARMLAEKKRRKLGRENDNIK